MIHRPVLLHEVLNILDVKADGIYVDATVGCGGHAREIAKSLKQGRLIGIDLDQKALQCAEEDLRPFAEKIKLIQANFKDLELVLDSLGISKIDGILFDLGVSSLQLDSPARGFSFRYDSELDMRMDQNSKLTAKEIVNNYSAAELIKILKDFGEERWASRIVEEIIKRRAQGPISTTKQLAEIIESAIPKAAQQKLKIHPATKTFQALRIAVNSELENLQLGLEAGYRRLKKGGVMAVISFHSLEDRMAKNFFKEKAQSCICPPDLPVCRCGKVVEVELFKPITPSLEERTKNPRARSARLRAARKIV